MIKGTYVFTCNGEEIMRQANSITKFGKRYLTSYLAGNSTSPARDMALGIDRSESLITAASASAGTITYTGKNYYQAGDVVSVYGLSTTAFNLSNVTVASANSTSFTVTNSATGTSVTNSSTGRSYRKSSENDTRLGFEFYRLPVNLSSIDIQTSGQSSSYAVVYKATIPQDVAGLISEIAIYPSVRSSISNYDSKFLADFYDALDWTTSTGYNPDSSTTGAKIGDSVLTFTSNSTSPKEYYSNVDLDLSGYSLEDTVRLAYYKNDNTLSKIRVKLYSSTESYYYYDITPQDGAGYKITPDITMANLLNTYSGSVAPDLSAISRVGFEIYPTSGNSTSVGMDGFRINDVDSFDPIYGMISRATLQTPLEKIAGRSVDIEYRLDIGF
jgi:hypothetical protein